MTNYTFMDLLKDKGQVPQNQETSLLLEIENSMEEIGEFLEFATTDYNFFDLLKDNGYGSVMGLVASNDNDVPIQEAS